MRRLVLSALLFALPLFAADVRLVPSQGGATLTFARAAAPASVHVALRFDPDKPANARVTLHALESGESATLTLDVIRVRTLAVAPGWYELSVAMPHHRQVKRTFHAIGELVALGAIALPRAPVISGTVRRGGAPLAGVRVTSGQGGSVVTSAVGKFDLEVTGDWPSELTIRAPGLGTKIVPLAAAEASVILPPVDLTPGASLRVTVDRNTFAGPLDVSLGVHERGAPARWLARQGMGGGNSVTFGDLDEGSYTILVAGPQPLERFAQPVNVGKGDRRAVTIPIRFVLAHGKLTMGGKPLGAVDVRFESPDFGWNSVVSTSPTGEISTPLWQTGAYALSIRGGASHAPIVRNVNFDERAFADFAIDVPDRRISGRIVDEDGVPVANAIVSLRSQTKTFAPTVRMRTSGDGTFGFDGVYEGSQTLTVIPEGFLYPNPRKFELTESDHAHEEIIALKRGSEREVRVLARDGAPLAGARVVIASDEHVRSAIATDERGRARISAPADVQSVVFVFPKEGSFVTRRLGPSEASVRIDVPPPGASLRIATLTTAGAPVPNVDMLVRYNGEILPPDVLRVLARAQGVSFGTNESGSAHIQNLPVGTYELWPYRSDNEAESLLASASGFAAPIVVNAVTGENKVTVRFRKKK